MFFRPYSRYVRNVPDREKTPFLREFLVTPDTPFSMMTDPPGFFLRVAKQHVRALLFFGQPTIVMPLYLKRCVLLVNKLKLK